MFEVDGGERRLVKKRAQDSRGKGGDTTSKRARVNLCMGGSMRWQPRIGLGRWTCEMAVVEPKRRIARLIGWRASHWVVGLITEARPTLEQHADFMKVS